jgi:hypothetical protein
MTQPSQPHEVFTPAGALGPGMFASRRRDGLEQSVVDLITTAGMHLALHGWTGVGKTSLVQHIVEHRAIPYLPVECGGSFDDLMRLMLDRLGERISKETVEGATTAGEAGAGVFGLFAGKVSGGTTSEVRYEGSAVQLETRVVEALVAAGVRLVFIDNLEDLAEGEDHQRGVCRLIKACSGLTSSLAHEAPTIVLAGPTDVVSSLLKADVGASRRTLEIEVPRMPPEEVDEILVRGETQLQMTFDEDCRRQIVETSDGFPYYAHLFALHTSRAAVRAGRRTITLLDFQTSLDGILSSCFARLKDAYGRATRGAGGQPSIRRAALAALAATDRIEVTVAEVEKAFLHAHPQYERVERVRFVGRMLSEMRDVHGIIEDVWVDDGRRGYRFRDPLMRAYVRLRAERDRQVATDRWRSALPPPPVQ